MTDLLIGHNLCNFDKKIFVIPTNIAIYERGFSKQESLARFLEVGYSKCFDESFIMQH
jgi:hypothetical protein